MEAFSSHLLPSVLSYFLFISFNSVFSGVDSFFFSETELQSKGKVIYSWKKKYVLSLQYFTIFSVQTESTASP